MPESLTIDLVNASQSSNIHCYVTGIALQHDNKRCFVKADSKLYFPENPEQIGTALAEDCAISLGSPGSKATITIPQIGGGRIWIADGQLTFFVNPAGPSDAVGALVEPSVFNPSDPNAAVNFGFTEFTLNAGELYANISYVDFTPRLPIAISCQESSGNVQRVEGMNADGIDQLAGLMREQASKDGKPWDKLVVGEPPLRVLSPAHAGAVGSSFDGYYEPLVEEIWQAYSSRDFTLDLKPAFDTYQGSTKSGKLRLGDEEFDTPTTGDILSCNTGTFNTAGAGDVRKAMIARLAAAFIRSTLPAVDQQPADLSTYYQRDPTNHYSRLVHQVNRDQKGYGFPYDDVEPASGGDQSGKVQSSQPALWTVTVGGILPN